MGRSAGVEKPVIDKSNIVLSRPFYDLLKACNER
jgi:hypothetical protein